MAHMSCSGKIPTAPLNEAYSSHLCTLSLIQPPLQVLGYCSRTSVITRPETVSLARSLTEGCGHTSYSSNPS